MAEQKVYEILEEGNKMVKALCDHEKTKRILWAVRPEEVVVLCVSNKERPEGCATIAVCRRVTPQMQAILAQYKANVKFAIELYGSDWQAMPNAKRQAVLFHELLHIPAPVDNGLVKHDVEDFDIMVQALGTKWFKADALPEILSGEVDFNLKLAPLGVSDAAAS